MAPRRNGIGEGPRQKIADLRKDAKQAFDDAQRYHAELNEIYRWYMPFRQPVSGRSAGGQQGEGQARTSHLFDGTGTSAAFSFAGTMQADWMPPHGEFFKLDPGVLVPEDQAGQLRLVFQDVSRRVHGSLARVHDSVHEMLVDLFAGTGAMLINPGSARYPIRGMAVPVTEIAMRDGPYGDPWWRWWRRKWRADAIEEMWPNGAIGKSLADAIKTAPETMVEVTQATIWDNRRERWVHVVWTDRDDPDEYLWHEEYHTSPWITPRFFKVPGESMGRGLAHLGLPFVKTTNKAQELALTAAAFAVMGLWIRRDDGVFNPDTATMAPGKMWTVASTGGARGPSIARLDVPKDFSISSIVTEDQRAQIRKVLMSDDLPDQQDPVRSATEIAGRLRRHARMMGGAGSRLSYELVTAIVERSIEVLGAKGLLPKIGDQQVAPKIDQILTQVLITAPAAAAQRSDNVERTVNWLQMVVMLLGPQAAMLAGKVEELAPQLGRWMGVEEKYIRGKDEMKELKDRIAQMAAAQSQAEKKPPTPAEQNQALVNGAGAQGMPAMGGMQ